MISRSKMSTGIELTENSYISIVTVGAGDGYDFMGCLYQTIKGSTPWRFDYRFRYHIDDKVFDSRDRKSWYHLKAKQKKSEDEVLRDFTPVLERMRGELNPFDILEIHGGVEEYSEAVRKHPAFTVKKIDPLNPASTTP